MELMVTVGIVAIMLSLVTISFQRLRSGEQLRSASRAVMSLIRQARSTVLRGQLVDSTNTNGLSAQVSFQSTGIRVDSDRLIVLFGDQDLSVGEEQVLNSLDLETRYPNSGIRIDTRQTPLQSEVRFKRNGARIDSGGRDIVIIDQLSGHTQVLSVTLAGVPRRTPGIAP